MIRLCAEGMAGDPTAFERAWTLRVGDYDTCIAAHYLARVQPDARCVRSELDDRDGAQVVT